MLADGGGSWAPLERQCRRAPVSLPAPNPSASLEHSRPEAEGGSLAGSSGANTWTRVQPGRPRGISPALLWAGGRGVREQHPEEGGTLSPWEHLRR